MREVKKPDVRKGEIVATALRLFVHNGYEKTTVDGIIRELGVAKGCFYHHFRSKEDLFEACALVASERFTADYLAILDDESAAPPTRLVTFLDYTYRLAADSDGYFGTPQSAVVTGVHQRVSDLVAARLQTAMTAVVDAGIAAGDFGVDDAEMAAAAVLGALTNMHKIYTGRPGLDLAVHRARVIALLGRMLSAELPTASPADGSLR